MIEKPFRWYHYTMPPFAAQLAVVLVCMLVTGAQMITYEIIEEDIVEWSGECDVTLGAFEMTEPEEGDPKRYLNHATMMCGEEERHLGALEMTYLYEVLTNDHTPVIVCEKTVSEYLSDVSWSCKMDPEKEST